MKKIIEDYSVRWFCRGYKKLFYVAESDDFRRFIPLTKNIGDLRFYIGEMQLFLLLQGVEFLSRGFFKGFLQKCVYPLALNSEL